MLKFKRHFIVGVLIITLSLGVTSCYPSDNPNGIQSYQGILQNIDSISGKVTLVLNDGSIVKINLKDVNVATIGKTSGIASLEAGTRITINKDRSGKVIDLKTHTAELGGVIKSIDPVKQKVTITLDEKGQITLNVTNDTLIILEGNVEATFAYLKMGQKIEASYDVENKNALKLNVYQEYTWAKRQVRGDIVSINREAQTITILNETGVETPPLKVTSSTKLWVNDKAIIFEGLYIGMEVRVKFNPETNELLKIVGKDPRSPIEKFLKDNG
ncbi:MAG TPA: hypothetical protein VGA85_01075 [Dehalococcoidales bacterium]